MIFPLLLTRAKILCCGCSFVLQSSTQYLSWHTALQSPSRTWRFWCCSILVPIVTVWTDSSCFCERNLLCRIYLEIRCTTGLSARSRSLCALYSTLSQISCTITPYLITVVLLSFSDDNQLCKSGHISQQHDHSTRSVLRIRLKGLDDKQYVTIQCRQERHYLYISNRLDNCNVLLSGPPKHLLNRLKKLNTMLLGSSIGLPNSIISHSSLHPTLASKWKKKTNKQTNKQRNKQQQQQKWFKTVSLCFISLNGSGSQCISDLFIIN